MGKRTDVHGTSTPLTLIETEVKWPRFENIASVPDERVIIINLVNQLIRPFENT